MGVCPQPQEPGREGADGDSHTFRKVSPHHPGTSPQPGWAALATPRMTRESQRLPSGGGEHTCAPIRAIGRARGSSQRAEQRQAIQPVWKTLKAIGAPSKGHFCVNGFANQRNKQETRTKEGKQRHTRKETRPRKSRERKRKGTRRARSRPVSRALTHGAGHEVDPGRLHLDVKPVAVGREQPCEGQQHGSGAGTSPRHPCAPDGRTAGAPPRGRGAARASSWAQTPQHRGGAHHKGGHAPHPCHYE